MKLSWIYNHINCQGVALQESTKQILILSSSINLACRIYKNVAIRRTKIEIG